MFILPISSLNGTLKLNEAPINITRIPFGKNVINHDIINNDTLRIFYPRGSYSPSKSLGGMGFFASPSEIFPSEHVTLHYSVYFHDSFLPTLGGKLPGLYISNGSFSGGSGGKFDDNISSCRIAWRKHFKAEAYIYATKNQSLEIITHKNKKYGDSLWRGDFNFYHNIWNNVSLTIGLNTIGNDNSPNSDGILNLTINNVTRHLDNFIWRKKSDVKISSMIFETFFGGSSPKTATPVDTWSYFRDVRLYARRVYTHGAFNIN
jgi:hypothetical protein